MQNEGNQRPESDQHGPMLHIVQPKRWYVLICIMILLISLIIWSFVGRIPVEVLGKGVELSTKGVFSIESKAPGIVTDIHISRGQVVDPSTLIMTLYNSQLSSIISHIRTTRYKVNVLEKELVILEESLSDKKKLFEKGLVAKSIYTDAQSMAMDKQIAIGEAQSSMASLLSDLEKNSLCGKEEIEGKEQELLNAEKEFDFSKIEKCMSSVFSPAKGKVLELLVRVGQHVDMKDPLVWLEHPSEEKNSEKVIFYAFVPVQSGRISPGMPVKIEPSTVNPQEYGAIFGKVKEVSPYAISQQELISTLHNKQLVDYLVGGATAVTQILIEPEIDEKTPSGFSWTSGEGPPFKIPTGTVASVKIVIEEQSPISYLIPLWKLKPKL